MTTCDTCGRTAEPENHPCSFEVGCSCWRSQPCDGNGRRELVRFAWIDVMGAPFTEVTLADSGSRVYADADTVSLMAQTLMEAEILPEPEDREYTDRIRNTLNVDGWADVTEFFGTYQDAQDMRMDEEAAS